MKRRFASLLALVLGVLAVRLTVTGEYLYYVRRGMFAWMILSGFVLVGLGVVGWMAARNTPDDRSGECSPGHSHSLSRAAWLLVVPVLVVGLTQPAPLGSFAANRQSARPPRQSTDVGALVQKIEDQSAPVPIEAVEEAPTTEPTPEPVPTVSATSVAGIPIPRPPAGEVAEMPLLDFLEITYYDETNALAGVPVRLIGFVMPAAGAESGQFLLSRFMINCCAADGTLKQVGVKDVKSTVPAKDTWVSVTGKWDPGAPNSQLSPDGFPVPELVADKVETIPPPENPYLSLAVS